MGSNGVLYPDSSKIGTTANNLNWLESLIHQPWHNPQAHAFQNNPKKLFIATSFSLTYKSTPSCCVGLMKMLTSAAVLTCLHYEKGYFNNNSKGNADAPFPADGFR